MHEGNNSEYLFFAGSSHPELAKEVAESLGISLGNISLNRFPDGEISLQVLDNVRGRDVFVLQTIALDPNNYLIELLIFVDALKRAAARSINVVIPYYGYCRQDRKDKPRVSIGAKLVANLLTVAGADRIITVDLHTDQIQGFFDGPVDHMHAQGQLAEYVREQYGTDNICVVSPDSGRVRVAEKWADSLNGAPLAFIHKTDRKSVV